MSGPRHRLEEAEELLRRVQAELSARPVPALDQREVGRCLLVVDRLARKVLGVGETLEPARPLPRPASTTAGVQP